MPSLRKGLMPFVLAVYGAGAQAGDGIEKAVDYRQGLMNVLAYNLTSMRDMVKGEVGFDAEAFARYAKDLAAAANLDMPAGFPEDSINDDSDASETIWLDWDAFQGKYKALQDQADKLTEVVAGGDEKAMKQQFGNTAKTCKGCHDDFKN